MISRLKLTLNKKINYIKLMRFFPITFLSEHRYRYELFCQNKHKTQELFISGFRNNSLQLFTLKNTMVF